jgi:hypothetical protein
MRLVHVTLRVDPVTLDRLKDTARERAFRQRTEVGWQELAREALSDYVAKLTEEKNDGKSA